MYGLANDGFVACLGLSNVYALSINVNMKRMAGNCVIKVQCYPLYL